MEEKKSRVLVSVDGTDESAKVVNYACEVLDPAGTEVVLFHVMSSVPEVIWDLEREPAWLRTVESIREYEKRQRENMEKVFTFSLRQFREAGFAEGSVSARIGVVEKGIARDILAESQKGYDVLLVGRGKSGARKEMPLGSVASKIVVAVPSPAVWLVGAQPHAEKILLAIDASENSTRAVKHVGKLLQRRKGEVTLFHAIRELPAIHGMDDLFPGAYQQRLIDEARQEIQPAFKLATLWLAKMGIPAERVDSKIVTGASSRAATILEEAAKGGYGTIIVGRRGVSDVQEFSMGRVTNKLVQTAKNQALWIVA